MAETMEKTENQEVATVFSMQQLDSSQRQALDAMAWDHCPTTAERKWLKPLADMAPPPFEPAPMEKITSVILALSAALPKQRTDEMRGETMLAVYQRQLRDMTTEEIEQSARKCLDELDWFPTIHQIKERAVGVLGKRLPTAEQNYHNRIRVLARRSPPSAETWQRPPLTEVEQRLLAAETAEILAGLRTKAKSERGAWSPR